MSAPIPKLTLATDGSCLRNPGGPTGWAWVAQDGTYAMGWDPSGTNQTAELWGLISALRDHPTGALTIQIDSKYTLDAAGASGARWEKAGWKTAAGQPVANLALIKTVRRLMSTRPDGHTVTLIKVPGHDPNNAYPLNTAVDKLAVRASNEAKTTGTTGKKTGSMDPFRTALAPSQNRAVKDGRGDAPGQRCASCNAVIRPFPPYCRCDLN